MEDLEWSYRDEAGEERKALLADGCGVMESRPDLMAFTFICNGKKEILLVPSKRVAGLLNRGTPEC